MKSYFHDIIPPEKRSIRNIPLSSDKSKKKNEDVTSEVTIKSEVRREKLYFSEEYDTPTKKSRGAVWLIAICVLIGLFFSISGYFTNAIIEIEPTFFIHKFNEPIKASLKVQNKDEVQYATITVTEEKNIKTRADGEKEVSTNSKGTIVVYNNFDSNSQKLIKGTRFESSGGLIYKLDEAIVVPGKKTEGGKAIPGSIEAKVTAEKPGPNYNSSNADFTIPGFKGDSRFNSFYARSKGEISGGSLGKIAIVSEEKIKEEQKKIEEDLKKVLFEKATKQIPDDVAYFDGGYELSYEVSDPKPDGENAIIPITGKLKLFIFNKNQLGNFIAEKSGNKVVEGKNLDIITKDLLINTIKETDGSLEFAINNQIKVFYQTDPELVKQTVAGTLKREIKTTLEKTFVLNNVRLVLKPFWLRKIPTNPEKISVKINN